MGSRADVDVGGVRAPAMTVLPALFEGLRQLFRVAAAELKGERRADGADHGFGQSWSSWPRNWWQSVRVTPNFRIPESISLKPRPKLWNSSTATWKGVRALTALQSGGMKRRNQERADQRRFLHAEFALSEAGDENFCGRP